MASAVLSSVLTTASRFALLQVDSGSGSDSEPGKGKGRNNGKSQTLGNKSTANEKKREKRRKKKEQQQSEANEVAMAVCVLGQGAHAISLIADTVSGTGHGFPVTFTYLNPHAANTQTFFLTGAACVFMLLN